MKVEINRRALAQWCFVLNIRLCLSCTWDAICASISRKKNKFIQGSQNTVKQFFKSNMKVEINRRALAQWCFVLNIRLCLSCTWDAICASISRKKNKFIQGSQNTVKQFFKSNMKVEINRRALAQWCFVLNIRLFVFLARGMPFVLLFLEKKQIYTRVSEYSQAIFYQNFLNLFLTRKSFSYCVIRISLKFS